MPTVNKAMQSRRQIWWNIPVPAVAAGLAPPELGVAAAPGLGVAAPTGLGVAAGLVDPK